MQKVKRACCGQRIRSVPRRTKHVYLSASHIKKGLGTLVLMTRKDNTRVFLHFTAMIYCQCRSTFPFSTLPEKSFNRKYNWFYPVCDENSQQVDCYAGNVTGSNWELKSRHFLSKKVGMAEYSSKSSWILLVHSDWKQHANLQILYSAYLMNSPPPQ